MAQFHHLTYEPREMFITALNITSHGRGTFHAHLTPSLPLGSYINYRCPTIGPVMLACAPSHCNSRYRAILCDCPPSLRFLCLILFLNKDSSIGCCTCIQVNRIWPLTSLFFFMKGKSVCRFQKWFPCLYIFRRNSFIY